MSKWIVSLSDGSTVIEKWEEGKLSPWIRLKEMCKERNLKITQLRLQVNGKTYTSVKGAQGYFQSCFVAQDLGEAPLLRRGIGYVNDSHLHILWVDDKTNDVWCEVRKAEGGAIIFNKDNE